MARFNFFNSIFRGSTSTNQFTQPINVGREYDHYLNGLLNTLTLNNRELEQWITCNNNEYEIYNTTPEVRLVINKGASLFSNGAWKLIDYKTGEEIEDHEILNLLKRPNPYEDKNIFLRGIYTSFALYGNSFSYLNYALPTSVFPKMINNLNAPQIKLLRSKRYFKQENIEHIITKYNLMKIDDLDKVIDSFEPKEIVHFREFNPIDPLLGSSRLKSLHMPISNIRAARGYINADYVKKGAIGILSPDTLKDGGGVLPTNQKHVNDLEKQYSEQTHGTGDKQSKIIISKMPIKYTSMSSALREHMVHEEIELSFKKIIDAYDLNESLFSFEKQSTFNNQENGEKQAYQNGIIPLANLYTSVLNDKLNLVEKIGAYLRLDYSHVSCFQTDETEKADEMKIKVETMEKLIGMGYSRDEAAAMVELKNN
jgi:phage portal protein BeeE